MTTASEQECAKNAPPEHEIEEGDSISPQTPGSQLTGESFAAGAEVEVRISSEGFHDSWYEAIVLRHNRATRHFKYKIQYLEFLRDDGSGEKLVEDVLAKNVRPRAPRRFSSNGPSFCIPNSEDEDPDFKMHDLVEAFHNDGWWHGVVSGIRNPDTGLYTVSFPNSREVFQFKPADIRPQLTFANGLWSPVLRIPEKKEIYKEGDKVDVFRERDEYGPSFFPARVEKVIHESYYLVKYESPDAQPNSDLTEILDPRYFRPAVDCMRGANLFMVGTHVEVFHRGGWSPGIVSSGLSRCNYAVTVESKGEQMTVEFHASNMRFRLDWDGRKWSKWNSPPKGKKRKSASSSETFSSDVSLGESESAPISVTFPGKKVKRERKESLGSDHEVPVSKFSQVKPELSKSTSNSSRIMRAVRKVTQSHKLLTELKYCHSKICTSKRSSTCKRNFIGSGTHKKQDKVDNNQRAASEKQKDANLSNENSSDVPRPNTNGEKETAHVGIPSCEQNLHCAADFAGENSVSVSPHDGTMGHIADSEGPCLLNTQGDSLTNGVTEIREGQLVDSQLLNSSATLEYPPGSRDNISNPSLSRLVPSVDPAACLPPSENSVSTDLSPNSEFNQHTLAEHILDKSVTPDIVLPFEVTSTIWKSLETTPVFVHIPQRPHFKMLESECEEDREGIAVGMMVNYVMLVDSIQKLNIHTELTVIEKKIALLDSLEKNGFIVDTMRSHLHRLLQIKTKCSNFVLKQVDLETKLAKKKDSLASVNVCEDKLADIKKSITELKEQLRILEMQDKAVMEERAGIPGSAAELELDISRIEGEIVSIKRSYELASEEFNCVISEPLY